MVHSHARECWKIPLKIAVTTSGSNVHLDSKREGSINAQKLLETTGVAETTRVSETTRVAEPTCLAWEPPPPRATC